MPVHSLRPGLSPAQGLTLSLPQLRLCSGAPWKKACSAWAPFGGRAGEGRAGQGRG